MKQVIFIELCRILKIKLNTNLVPVNGVKERKFIFKFSCISPFVSSHVLFFVLILKKAKDKQKYYKLRQIDVETTTRYISVAPGARTLNYLPHEKADRCGQVLAFRIWTLLQPQFLDTTGWHVEVIPSPLSCWNWKLEEVLKGKAIPILSK